MKKFRIFINQAGGLRAIKKGWSWPAFLFTILYTVYARLWPAFLFLFSIFSYVIAISVGFFYAAHQEERLTGVVYNFAISPIYILICLASYLVIALAIGATANHMRSKRLVAKDYIEVASIMAPSAAQAVKSYSDGENDSCIN